MMSKELFAKIVEIQEGQDKGEPGESDVIGRTVRPPRSLVRVLAPST